MDEEIIEPDESGQTDETEDTTQTVTMTDLMNELHEVRAQLDELKQSMQRPKPAPLPPKVNEEGAQNERRRTLYDL